VYGSRLAIAVRASLVFAVLAVCVLPLLTGSSVEVSPGEGQGVPSKW